MVIKYVLNSPIPRESLDKYELRISNTLKTCMTNGNMYDENRVVQIDFGDWQGTKVYIFPKATYQPLPFETFTTWVYYGSCSGCDTLLRLAETVDKKVKLTGYMSLCLHLLQHIRSIDIVDHNDLLKDTEDIE